MSPRPSVALVTLGCGRNEVDSEELAGRLEADGWRLVSDPGDADVALVNTCGFIEAAKHESVETLLQAADLKGDGGVRAVVATGCLAERYGRELADALPEADAVLGFDEYAAIGQTLRGLMAGKAHVSHTPRDRRELLPLTPVRRPAAANVVPGHGRGPHEFRLGPPDLPEGLAPRSGPHPWVTPLRRRLAGGPVAPLKLASGCDRRCSFCAIPTFRGAFLSRPPGDVVAEAYWLAGEGVRELVLVSENSTSYGKDLGDVRLLERLLPELAAVPGIRRVRVSYLQPAEMRPTLVDVMTETPGIAPYFDLSFQHASPAVLRRMRRFGGTERFHDLLGSIRDRLPEAGVRSNVIVGFPGETESDLDELERFLVAARLDAVGVFGYSDEEGTEAATFAGKLDEDTVRARTERVSMLVEELTSQRADDRVGEVVEVLVEQLGDGAVDGGVDGAVDGGVVEGRAAHQAPEVDGSTVISVSYGLGGGFGAAGGDSVGGPAGDSKVQVGAVVRARVVRAEGVDLHAELCEVVG
ncbi:MAG: MiaB/RimO family radical SAM methylthiotransferase [Carbonactinosporaceae bacterium]